MRKIIIITCFLSFDFFSFSFLPSPPLIFLSSCLYNYFILSSLLSPYHPFFLFLFPHIIPSSVPFPSPRSSLLSLPSYHPFFRSLFLLHPSSVIAPIAYPPFVPTHWAQRDSGLVPSGSYCASFAPGTQELLKKLAICPAWSQLFSSSSPAFTRVSTGIFQPEKDSYIEVYLK